METVIAAVGVLFVLYGVLGLLVPFGAFLVGCLSKVRWSNPVAWYWEVLKEAYREGRY